MENFKTIVLQDKSLELARRLRKMHENSDTKRSQKNNLFPTLYLALAGMDLAFAEMDLAFAGMDLAFEGTQMVETGMVVWET